MPSILELKNAILQNFLQNPVKKETRKNFQKLIDDFCALPYVGTCVPKYKVLYAAIMAKIEICEPESKKVLIEMFGKLAIKVGANLLMERLLPDEFTDDLVEILDKSFFIKTPAERLSELQITAKNTHIYRIFRKHQNNVNNFITEFLSRCVEYKRELFSSLLTSELGSISIVAASRERASKTKAGQQPIDVTKILRENKITEAYESELAGFCCPVTNKIIVGEVYKIINKEKGSVQFFSEAAIKKPKERAKQKATYPFTKSSIINQDLLDAPEYRENFLNAAKKGIELQEKDSVKVRQHLENIIEGFNWPKELIDKICPNDLAVDPKVPLDSKDSKTSAKNGTVTGASTTAVAETTLTATAAAPVEALVPQRVSLEEKDINVLVNTCRMWYENYMQYSYRYNHDIQFGYFWDDWKIIAPKVKAALSAQLVTAKEIKEENIYLTSRILSSDICCAVLKTQRLTLRYLIYLLKGDVAGLFSTLGKSTLTDQEIAQIGVACRQREYDDNLVDEFAKFKIRPEVVTSADNKLATTTVSRAVASASTATAAVPATAPTSQLPQPKPVASVTAASAHGAVANASTTALTQVSISSSPPEAKDIDSFLNQNCKEWYREKLKKYGEYTKLTFDKDWVPIANKIKEACENDLVKREDITPNNIYWAAKILDHFVFCEILKTKQISLLDLINYLPDDVVREAIPGKLLNSQQITVVQHALERKGFNTLAAKIASFNRPPKREALSEAEDDNSFVDINCKTWYCRSLVAHPEAFIDSIWDYCIAKEIKKALKQKLVKRTEIDENNIYSAVKALHFVFCNVLRTRRITFSELITFFPIHIFEELSPDLLLKKCQMDDITRVCKEKKREDLVSLFDECNVFPEPEAPADSKSTMSESSAATTPSTITADDYARWQKRYGEEAVFSNRDWELDWVYIKPKIEGMFKKDLIKKEDLNITTYLTILVLDHPVFMGMVETKKITLRELVELLPGEILNNFSSGKKSLGDKEIRCIELRFREKNRIDLITEFHNGVAATPKFFRPDEEKWAVSVSSSASTTAAAPIQTSSQPKVKPKLIFRNTTNCDTKLAIKGSPIHSGTAVVVKDEPMPARLTYKDCIGLKLKT